jgi:hypothetical protein
MKDEIVNIRLSKKDKEKIRKKAKNMGFRTVSDYLRVCGLNADMQVIVDEKKSTG